MDSSAVVEIVKAICWTVGCLGFMYFFFTK